MRNFDTGATRNTDENKLDYEAFLSPLVLERFAAYMHKHRVQADGNLREGDNWQKGIPKQAYIKSAWRHFFSWWKSHRGLSTEEDIEESMMALLFNLQGYAHEYLKEKGQPTSQTLNAGIVSQRGGGSSDQHNGPMVGVPPVRDPNTLYRESRDSRNLHSDFNH